MLISSFIPEYMNSFYSEQCLSLTSLPEIRDMLRLKQIKGKAWFLSHFIEESRSKNILIIGGWLGFTSFVLYKLGFTHITEIDLDPRSAVIATHANRFNKNFKHAVIDVNQFSLEGYDIVINTSCEHISQADWFNRLPIQTKIYLQSTDLISDDHTNICETVEQMAEKYPTDPEYCGELNLDQYSRFMLIGRIV